MQRNCRYRDIWLALVVLTGGFLSTGNLWAQSSDPWQPTQVAQPSTLVARLARQNGTRPVVIQVGFDVLYRSKHIPGAIYAGPASSPEGLDRLKAAVEKLPKAQEIYLYCGCCPIDKCPNIRPAFQLLRKMGFTHVKMLLLPNSFGRDWVAPGYPVAGESAGSPSAGK